MPSGACVMLLATLPDHALIAAMRLEHLVEVAAVRPLPRSRQSPSRCLAAGIPACSPASANSGCTETRVESPDECRRIAEIGAVHP